MKPRLLDLFCGAGGCSVGYDRVGIDWMTKPGDVSDAIPPNYTEYIGGQLIDALARAAA